MHATWVAVGSGSAVVVTLLNYLGIRPASLFQTLAVLFLLGVGALLVLGALTGGEREHLTPLFRGGAGGVLTVLVAVPFLFVGFDVVPQSAAEINLPRRLVGTLLVLSVVCAALWYVLVMLTVGAGLGPDALASADLASAEGMAALWHSPLMGDVLVLGGIAGILTSWNAFLIGASRLLYAMAASRMLPTWFARLHPRFRTPSNAVLFVGGLSALAPLFGESMLEWLVNAGGINIVVAYVVVVLSFLRLRHREPAMERPFRAPAGQLVGILALLLSLALGTLYLPGMPAALTWPAEWLIAGAWWTLGALLLLRLPWTGAGADAEGRLVAAVERRRGR
ncbi:APC family permease [Streptomyces sp. HNM0574]|uniref:amino acid permease n=1 Tax=Streptomyces sp. HNM0574 TaxID=2714954 RepID=UPI00146F8476|nr:APC family permease [Streptomyces sp. HNM0574]